MIKALIFDLDGTLLNTIDDITKCANLALEQLGLDTYDVSRYKLFVGNGVNELIERCLKNQNASMDYFDSLKKIYLDNYLLYGTEQTKPYEGILSLLDYAKEKGLFLGVMSNKPHRDTLAVIDYYFGLSRFTKVYGKLAGYEPKPNPQKLNELIEELNVSKDEILYFGDTLVDMQTATNAGLKKVAVLWGFRGIEELKMGNPDYIISTPEEVKNLL